MNLCAFVGVCIGNLTVHVCVFVYQSLPASPNVSTEGSEQKEQPHVKVLDSVWQVGVFECLESTHESWDGTVHTTQTLDGAAIEHKVAQAFLCFSHNCGKESVQRMDCSCNVNFRCSLSMILLNLLKE